MNEVFTYSVSALRNLKPLQMFPDVLVLLGPQTLSPQVKL